MGTKVMTFDNFDVITITFNTSFISHPPESSSRNLSVVIMIKKMLEFFVSGLVFDLLVAIKPH